MRICYRVNYTNSPDESKAKDAIKTPNLLAGFQAAGTGVARLFNHETHLKIHGDMVPMNAKVVPLTGTSAHADYQEILAWIGLLKKRPQHIFITYGEPQAAFTLQQHGFT